ncbi:MAG: YceI family protein [Actinomycetota bacterium]|nr:YceI family protein [Actinomycetota bacterium]
MAQVIETRKYEGQAVPPVGKYRIDPAHSSVEFVSRHLMLARVRGRFQRFSGYLEVAEDPRHSTVEVTIEAASIDTNEEQRDNHLRSEDFLYVEEYPEITFRSTGAQFTDDRWQVSGELTIRGQTRPTTLEVEFLGLIRDPYQQDKALFSATTKLSREDYDITWNQPLEAGGFLVGDQVDIELEVQAVRE